MQPFQDGPETLGHKTKRLGIWPVGDLDGKGDSASAGGSGRRGEFNRLRTLAGTGDFDRHGGFGRSGRDSAGAGNSTG